MGRITLNLRLAWSLQGDPSQLGLYNKTLQGIAEVAQLMTCLPCKCEDLSSDFQRHRKMLRVAICVSNPRASE